MLIHSRLPQPGQFAISCPCRFDMQRWKRYYQWNHKKPDDLLAFFWKSFEPESWSLYCMSYRNQDSLFAPFQVRSQQNKAMSLAWHCSAGATRWRHIHDSTALMVKCVCWSSAWTSTGLKSAGIGSSMVWLEHARLCLPCTFRHPALPRLITAACAAIMPVQQLLSHDTH